MSVWVLFKHVDYEGTDENTIRIFRSRQKAEQEQDRLNKVASQAYFHDTKWCITERNIE